MKARIVSLVSVVLLLLASQANAQVELTLRVEHEQEKTVYRDQPAIFQLTVSDPYVTEAARWNDKVDEYLRELDSLLRLKRITSEYHNSEREVANRSRRNTQVLSLGTPATGWAEQVELSFRSKDGRTKAGDVIVHLMPFPSVDNSISLTPDAHYDTHFGISPEKMQTLPAGSYEVVVSINGVLSEQVTLEVRAEKMTAQVLATPEMLLYLGRYYLNDGNANRAFGYAEQLLKQNANSLDGMVLRAESRQMRGENTLALTDFERALTLFYQQEPNSYEAPSYILMSIASLKQ